MSFWQSGVFVLETKNWNGVITCNEDEWQRAVNVAFLRVPAVKSNVMRRELRIVDNSPTLRSIEVGVEGIVVLPIGTRLFI